MLVDQEALNLVISIGFERFFASSKRQKLLHPSTTNQYLDVRIIIVMPCYQLIEISSVYNIRTKASLPFDFCSFVPYSLNITKLIMKMKCLIFGYMFVGEFGLSNLLILNYFLSRLSESTWVYIQGLGYITHVICMYIYIYM